MKTGFFEERPGVHSSMRLYSFILLLFFIAFNLLWIRDGKDISENLLVLDLIMLVGIFVPKYLQKIVEAKINNVESK